MVFKFIKRKTFFYKGWKYNSIWLTIELINIATLYTRSATVYNNTLALVLSPISFLYFTRLCIRYGNTKWPGGGNPLVAVQNPYTVPRSFFVGRPVGRTGWWMGGGTDGTLFFPLFSESLNNIFQWSSAVLFFLFSVRTHAPRFRFGRLSAAEKMLQRNFSDTVPNNTRGIYAYCILY